LLFEKFGLRFGGFGALCGGFGGGERGLNFLHRLRFLFLIPGRRYAMPDRTGDGDQKGADNEGDDEND
jgi:hypothetical protein